MRVAVLMLNLGGPANLGEVTPFLRNLFRDREIIRFPGGSLGQRFFAWWISRRKAAESARNYAAIGGGSPLLRWTRAQGDAMKRLVELETGLEIRPLPCMRYWYPFADEALREAVDGGAEHIVAFTQYPHDSMTTTGGSLREVRRVAARLGLRVPMTAITSWHDHPSYIAALADCVREGVGRVPFEFRPGARVVYSAHSLPMKFVDAGDPYPGQIRETAALVHAEAGLLQHYEIAWQSKAGPVRWLAPSSIERIRALPAEGVRDVVVVPISFVNDHIETLQELDIALAEEARRAGMRTFVRAPGLNLRAPFVRALADVLVAHLRAQGVLEPVPSR
ncbi:MAG: ferrochelatase [Planctomycetes bacterium]|nr:ferrochelatase [Planctomycetota bacterium]